jgi:hypothetical protein
MASQEGSRVIFGEIVRTGGGAYLQPGPGEVISSQAEVLELLARCSEAGTDRLLFPEGNLAADFFDLSTGLAGEIALKLSTYRIRAAIVVDLDALPSQRFREWAGECNRGNELYFNSREQDAVQWLLR